jgi:hypothetical protein
MGMSYMDRVMRSVNTRKLMAQQNRVVDSKKKKKAEKKAEEPSEDVFKYQSPADSSTSQNDEFGV